MNSAFAQLSPKEKEELVDRIRHDANYYGCMEGAQVYKTSAGNKVLIPCAVTYTSNNITEQNTITKQKAERIAAEYIAGATERSVTSYETSSTYNSSSQNLFDRIDVTTMAKVKGMQVLTKIYGVNGDVYYYYYLILTEKASKNGVAGALSMIAPSSGQYYKGSYIKGTVFLTLTAAAVTGIIITENNRASYVNKSIEQPKYMQEYINKANQSETARNIFIGVGGIVYVWNVIDAFTTKGAERKLIKDLSFSPTLDNKGICITYKF